MIIARRTALIAVLTFLVSGSLTPARAQLRGASFIIKISAEPSIGGTAIGAATGSINGSPLTIPEAAWTDTHSDRSPLFEGGIAIPVAHILDVVALVNVGHADADAKEVGDLGGTPVTAQLTKYSFWGLEGGVHLRRSSGAGPYATVTAGFRSIDEIDANLNALALNRSVAVYDSSAVPTFCLGGGILFGDRGFALGVEVAVRYAGAPGQSRTQTVIPASGAGVRWSLPVGIVFKF
jgi:hypothetical protein